ncbi:hypothetical protein POI8812_02712 [Pontivivens insulae]|uniref:DinB family protein n=2 Tax=Pontivivens insulae TaxID=1639689 RepID=A0A2R8ADR1_9RHOB|nr:putative damage-inducible protein DinB [Pontivivens insulae]SPF30376.1 hypothetical protein POI8812_02712 [Pontivivens insulae]
MITAEYARQMTRYTRWQNTSLLTAADGLTDQARRQDRGAFFGSIAATLNHLLWGDRLWLCRLTGADMPNVGSLTASATEILEWDSYKSARATCDADLTTWAEALTDEDTSGDVHWHSFAMNRAFVTPRDIAIIHLFNHGTHHRGQVHAMLTAAGAKPDDTDLPFMPVV